MLGTMFQPSTMVYEKRKMQTNTVHRDISDTQMLKMEAEKIRQWQVQTEINTKKMEKQMQNLRMTVESQRRSLLEVQLEYESVGNKMQEEINKRALCQQKIESTRDMCGLLKNQACGLEKTLSFCDTVTEDLNYKQVQNDSLIEKLTADFEKLCNDNEKAKVNFTKKLNKCQSNHEQEKEKLLQEVERQKHTISKCEQDLVHKETVVDTLSYCLVNLEELGTKKAKSNAQLTVANDQLSSALKASSMKNTIVKSVANDQKMLREKRENELRVAEKVLKNAESVCKQLQEKINEQSRKAIDKDEKIEYLEDKLSAGIVRIKHLDQHLEGTKSELQRQSQKIEEFMHAENDMKLQMELLSKSNQASAEQHVNDLEELSRCNYLISQNKELIYQLTEDLAVAKSDKESIADELKISRQENNQTLEELKKSNSEIVSLKQEIDAARKSMEDFHYKIDSCQNDQSSLREELNQQTSKNVKLSEELDELKKLKDFPGKLKSLQSEFNEQSNKLKEALNSCEEMRSTMQEKDKQLVECNDSLAESKQVVEDQAKSLKSSSRLYNELLIIRNDQTQELNTLHRDLKSLKDSMNLEKQNHQVAIEKLEKERKEEVKELEDKVESLTDKLQIFKEEAEMKKKSVAVEPSKKRTKRGHFSPLYTHDVSMGGKDISASVVLPYLVEKQMANKQPAPKHCSTPIRQTPKPSKHFTSSKKIRSSKKTFWKRATPRVIVKTPSGAQKKKSVDNWFDTDNVYGFFE